MCQIGMFAGRAEVQVMVSIQFQLRYLFVSLHRSLVQIKSHAQKVLKRLDAGENVFQMLEDNRERLEVLLAEAHDRIQETEAVMGKCKTPKRRKRTSARKPTSPYPSFAASWDHFDSDAAVRMRQEGAADSSPVPSLTHEDPPGQHISLEQSPEHTSWAIPDDESSAGGTGAVIAAVAALCQLSSCGNP
jgi:hypothetical protein